MADLDVVVHVENRCDVFNGINDVDVNIMILTVNLLSTEKKYGL